MSQVYKIRVRGIPQAAAFVRGIVDAVPGLVIPGDRYNVERSLANGGLQVFVYRGEDTSPESVDVRYSDKDGLILSGPGCDGIAKNFAAIDKQ